MRLIFAPFWPAVNTATKYVASNTMTSHEWQPAVFLNGDIAEKISKIKQQEGPDLHVYGSANLVQTLMKHDLCRHKHQPHRIFSDNIALHQSQWRTRRGEVWLAAAQHEWTQIKAIFVDQTKLSKTPRKLRPRNVDVAIDLRLQPRSERAHIIHHKRGIGANRLQRVRCNPFRLRAPRRRKVALVLVPVWLVLIPITHHLIHAPSIQHSRKPTHVIVEMATQRRSWRRQHRSSRHSRARRR